MQRHATKPAPDVPKWSALLVEAVNKPVQLQNWLCPAIGYNGDAIPEKSAQKIFRAADQILRAGRLQASENEQE